MKKTSLLVLLTALFFSTALHAGLTITPQREEILVEPGGKYKGTYNVRSDYRTDAHIKISSREWFAYAENKGLQITDWLSVTPPEFELKPGESRDVEYEVSLPKSAKGVVVAMISFMPTTEEEQGVSLIISVPVFVVARGTEKVDWKINEVKLAGRGDKFQVLAGIENRGNIHLRPTGSVRILSGKNVVADVGFMESRPVYPGLSRSVVANSGSGTALNPGRYTAAIDVRCYDQEKTKKVNFEVTESGDLVMK